MSTARRAALALGWVAVLALVAVWVGGRLQLSGDLREFMPAPQTADQRLMLEGIGEGPGARLLLVALSGLAPARLAEVSQDLAEALRARPAFLRVMNGDESLAAIDDSFLAYRYLLSPTLDRTGYDAAYLRIQLAERLQDLGSPAAARVEPWIARDPTLEVLTLFEHWRPAHEPVLAFGVWFTPARDTALLLVETEAAGFDPEAQQAALAALDQALAEVADEPTLRLEVTGPGAFSVLMRERTQAEATRLTALASVAILLALALAYRSATLPLLAALPLATALVAGVATVTALFGGMHGITLAFGATLIGIALDYPVHLFSHRRAGEDAWTTVRELWPTLAAGAISTCLAYASFLASGVDGLTQLAAFTVAGLLAAALATRWLLPALLPAEVRPPGEARWLARIETALAGWPSPAPLAGVAAAAALVWLLASPQALWDDELARLTPLPGELVQRDAELRAALGATDARHMLVLEGSDHESLLQRCEGIEIELQALVTQGTLAGFEAPCRYLPSQRTQRARQARLPAPATLAAELAEASLGQPFREGAFAPFLREVERARGLAPLTPADLVEHPLGARISSLLPASASPPVALIGLIGLSDPRAVADFAATYGDDLRLLDLKTAAQDLAAGYRQRMLLALPIAALALTLALGVALRRPVRVLRVLAPVLLAAPLTLAALHAGGIAFNLFHLVALILASGLGLDYALFFERAGRSLAARRRTLHAVGVGALSTVLVFGLLASSDIPVLRALGLTVAVGVTFNLVLAVLIAGGEARHARA